MPADDPIRVCSFDHAIELLDGWISAYESLERAHKYECYARQGLAERIRYIVNIPGVKEAMAEHDARLRTKA